MDGLRTFTHGPTRVVPTGSVGFRGSKRLPQAPWDEATGRRSSHRHHFPCEASASRPQDAIHASYHRVRALGTWGLTFQTCVGEAFASAIGRISLVDAQKDLSTAVCTGEWMLRRASPPGISAIVSPPLRSNSPALLRALRGAESRRGAGRDTTPWPGERGLGRPLAVYIEHAPRRSPTHSQAPYSDGIPSPLQRQERPCDVIGM
jgi:hypothetical protein